MSNDIPNPFPVFGDDDNDDDRREREAQRGAYAAEEARGLIAGVGRHVDADGARRGL